MIQHLWTVPCRVSITDQETNNVSLISVLEELTISPPLTRENPLEGLLPAMFDLITLWARENLEVGETGYARTSFVSPTGEELSDQMTEVDLRVRKRLRAVSRFLGFPIQQTGVYRFKVERRATEAAGWQEVASIPLEVNIDLGLEQSQEDADRMDRE